MEGKIHAERLQLHREKVASPLRPVIWQKLVDRISGEIQTQNAFASSEQANLSWLRVSLSKRAIGDGLSLVTASFPMATVEIRLEDKRLISIHCSYQKTDLSEVQTWNEFMKFKVDENDNVYLEHNGEPVTIDQATLIAIRPVRRDPDFKPPV